MFRNERGERSDVPRDRDPFREPVERESVHSRIDPLNKAKFRSGRGIKGLPRFPGEGAHEHRLDVPSLLGGGLRKQCPGNPGEG